MNEPATPRRTFLPWEELRTRLDEGPHFNTMRGTPYYRDAVYEQFSKEEYARRYAALRAKMREHKLDRRDRARRSEPLELRRRHAVAHRPLGMACAVLLRGGAARRRADPRLLHGRHPCRGGAARDRGGALGRARQPRRPVCRGDGGPHRRARPRPRPHRPARDRSPPQGLPAGQPVRDAQAAAAGRRARVHRAASSTSSSPCTARRSSTACGLPASSARTP